MATTLSVMVGPVPTTHVSTPVSASKAWMVPQKLPHPARGRVGVGVNSGLMRTDPHPASPLQGEVKEARSMGNRKPLNGLAAWEATMPEFARKPEHTARARRLRRDMTPMEKKLWYRLQGEQLGVSFRRQHSIGVYIVDFAAPSVGLVVELDGGQHGTDAALVTDAVRTRFLESKGFTVMRFWNNEMFENGDGVVETIWLKVQQLRAMAQSVPPPARGRSGGGKPQGETSPGLTPTPTLPLAGGGSGAVLGSNFGESVL
jgi:very-short-patch-repair endonuclease